VIASVLDCALPARGRCNLITNAEADQDATGDLTAKTGYAGIGLTKPNTDAF
jgi:hypothetical protein